ncbi:hypothetical protein K5549_013945 [Capra hircus]|uniref:Uncharacterized protein n=1 Tax=Capra hircus TaxID=9925 RepID=A0A452G101_CAPHI|nr:hypothetical protein K5549_013945 [Capra hircus]
MHHSRAEGAAQAPGCVLWFNSGFFLRPSCFGPSRLHVPRGGVSLASSVWCVFPCLHELLWFCVVCPVPPLVL